MHLMKTPAILLPAVLISLFFVGSAATNAPREATSNAIVSTTSVVRETNYNTSTLFTDLHLGDAGMSSSVFNSALKGMEKLDSEGDLKRKDIITIIDYSQPSNKKRLYVLDLATKQVLFNTLVAHGRNSGKLWARSFSNNPSSLKSSPGFYVTGDSYIGDNGYSLRLNGMEKNINDRAFDRSIVLHGAAYVDESAIGCLGFLGRSWGCPAVPISDHREIIDAIKDGTCLFIYSPNTKYLARSPILNS